MPVRHGKLSWLRYVAGIVITIWVGGPVAWLAFTSFRIPARVLEYPPNLKGPFTLANYRYIFSNLDIGAYLINSLIVDIAATVAAVGLGFAAAYGISQMQHRTSRIVQWTVMICRMVPAVSLIVPIYFIYNKIGLLDSRLGLAIMYSATSLPLAIWMLSAYLRQIPDEVIQAAWVDGAGSMRLLRSVLAPMMVPGIVVVLVLTFLANWSEFMLAVTLTSSATSATLPVALVQLDQVYGVAWQYMSAAVMVAISIPILIGALLQRRIVSGLTIGAIR